jgi:hypothetical protein
LFTVPRDIKKNFSPSGRKLLQSHLINHGGNPGWGNYVMNDDAVDVDCGVDEDRERDRSSHHQ